MNATIATSHIRANTGSKQPDIMRDTGGQGLRVLTNDTPHQFD